MRSGDTAEGRGQGIGLSAHKFLNKTAKLEKFERFWLAIRTGGALADTVHVEQL